jgi:hypothetical protein
MSIHEGPTPAESHPVQAPGFRVFQPRGRPEDADFLMPAPREIGPLCSAHTSLLKTTKNKPFWLRLLIGALLGVGTSALLAVGLLIGLRLPVDAAVALFLGFSIVLTPVTVGFTLYYLRFRHYCGYVGERGLAYCTCAGSRKRVKRRETLLFADVDHLVASVTRQYRNFTYTGTIYFYIWADEAGNKVFRVNGTHQSERGLPPPQDQFHFALAAEEAWGLHLLESILPRLQAGEPYRFRLGSRDGIVVHKEYLELSLWGKVQRFAPEDLAEIRVQDGTITLKEPGARGGWFTSTGVHCFSFSDLANAQVFLLLMEKMYGVTTS